MTSTPYRPAPWLKSAHAMTVFASLARVFPMPRARRERWELPDGDFLDVDRYPGATAAAPVLVVCHGLEGSSRAPYVRGIVALAMARGMGALALNFRGCSGVLNRLPRFYHSGDTDDLDFAVQRLVGEDPERSLVLAGFSLGGNVIAKYLGERGDGLPRAVRGAAVISVPFDLARSAELLDGGGAWSWIYRERFLRQLRRKALAKAATFPEAFDVPRVRAARTFAAYDECVTARLHGFASAADYYGRASSGRYLEAVRRPLLAVAALDDPLVPADTLPRAAARENPALTLDVTDSGGHVAFVGGWPFWPSYWAERRAIEFLVDVLGAGEAGAS